MEVPYIYNMTRRVSQQANTVEAIIGEAINTSKDPVAANENYTRACITMIANDIHSIADSLRVIADNVKPDNGRRMPFM